MPLTFQPRRVATLVSILGALAIVATVAPAHSASQSAVQAQQKKPDAAFDKWANAFAADWVRLDPESSSTLQYFAPAQQQVLDRQYAPLTEASRAKRLALARSGLARLDVFLARPLDDTQRISAETMRWSLQQTVAAYPYLDHHFVFQQFSGTHVNMVNFLATRHPLRRAADVESYLARLGLADTILDQALVRARSAIGRKLIPPRFIVARAQAQVDTFLAAAPDKNALVASLEQRMAALPDMTPQERAAAVAKATAIVGSKLLPAFGRVKVFLAEVHPLANDEAGLSRLSDGASAYRQALATYTGSTLSPDEIHMIGLREVARLEAAMDGHLRTLGFKDGSIGQRMSALDKSLQPKGEGDPRAALLQRYTAMVRDAEQRSTSLFNLKPRAPIDIRREPPMTEATASAHYSTPAPDGSLPGIFWVPMPGPEFDMTKMRTLSYHEGVPGHHFQLAIQQELSGLPKFRTSRVFGGGSSHSEGWALYTERLAVEQGWYDGDVPGLLGALNAELFRARRLVVDTGLHSKGWTRQQAIDYGVKAQEVERYVVNPGQACSYMLGMLRILDMRAKARLALGDKFNLPGFHDVILRTGSVPLDVLAKEIDRWVAQQANAPMASQATLLGG